MTELAARDKTISTLHNHGRLRVHVSHATGLRAGSDPYLALNLGGRTERTEVVKRTLEPQFDWDFVFAYTSVDAALGQTMKVEAYDHNVVLDDKKIGGGSLRLEKLRRALEKGEAIQCVVPLVYKTLLGRLETAGQVFVSLAWEARGDTVN